MNHITFEIPYPPTKKGKTAFCRRFGMNAYYSGKHWAARKADADELHQLLWLTLRKAKIPKCPVDCPVSIIFSWDDGLDIDNHAVMGKAFVDALKGWVLPDDNRKCVKRVTHEFNNAGVIRVKIEEVQCQKTNSLSGSKNCGSAPV